MLTIYPEKIKNFRSHRNPSFYLVVTPALSNQVSLQSTALYSECHTIVCEPQEDIDTLVKNKIPDHADIFFMPYWYPSIHFFPRRENLLPHQRFVAMPCSLATPVNLHDISYFLNVIYDTDPEELQSKVDNFFKTLGDSKTITFINHEYDTSAVLNLNKDCLWTEICGHIHAGEIGIAPSAELALTHVEFKNPHCSLDITGDLLLQGCPILHVHDTQPSCRHQQSQLFTQLTSLQMGALKVTLVKGVIQHLEVLKAPAQIACDAFEKLLATTEAYRTLIEVGIGLHHRFRLVDGNKTMNETYGGDHQCVHFGMGAFGSTLYHLDVLCPATSLMSDAHRLLVGPGNERPSRRQGGYCPCEN
ncbi:MAG: hypothetical protein A3F17_06495 [Gammaproteobacteria bacterium RIFCSPHIGHO2_12_FULL_41_15]|nr:MAG: hypothetical protein A3F17_06495 [Gammaproteobacteria bacterium RIFCSPHIGHO2_12_FULL_41_15]